MCGLPGVKDIANFQIWSHSPFGLDYIVYGGGGGQEIESNRISSKNSCKQGLMPNACTPILVGIAFLVLEIITTFKIGEISLLDHGLFIVLCKNLIE